MSTKRTYGDGCGVAVGLDLVGERWALLVVRELLLGPKRFTDLRAGLPQASPNVLSMRLRELEDSGVVRRRRLGPPLRAQVYELTEWGAELEQVLLHLGMWAARSPRPSTDPYRSVDSFVLWLLAAFDGTVAPGLAATYAMSVGDDEYVVTVADGRVGAERGPAGAVDARFGGTFEAVVELLKGDEGGLDAAVATGAVRCEGDREAVRTLIRSLPERRGAAV